MSTLNRVFLMGNLTRDPEVRYTPAGVAVGDLALAVNETYKNKAGEPVEHVVFLEVEVWARQAEACYENLLKGSPVFVEGRLKLDQWKNQKGENRKKLLVRADKVQFLGPPRRHVDEGDAPTSTDPVVPTPALGPTAPPSASITDNDDIPF